MIKRSMLFVAAVLMTASSFAQGSFTVKRPLSGATVRETVPIRIPLDAIPQTGFVGVWVNGVFLEAVAPIAGVNVFGNDFVYKLDTKARKIRDGKMDIELVLYADAGRSNRVLNKTSLSLTLDNFSSIRIPANGLKLRYSLKPNMEYTYRLNIKQSLSLASDTDIRLNRENPLQTSGETLRYKIAVVSQDWAKDLKVGTLLLQPLTEKGKDYSWLTLSGQTERKKYYDYMMHPIYMRVDDMGREKWGGAPFYLPFEGSAGDVNRLDLFGVFPLPILPARGLKMSAPTFAGTVQSGILDLEKLREQRRFTQTSPAKGVFEGVEWERGLRCAKIRNSISVGTKSTGMQDYEERYWFALDLGMVIRLDRTTTRIIEQRATQQAGGGAGAGGGGGGPRRGASGGGGAGAGSAASGAAEFFAPQPWTGDLEVIMDPAFTLFQGRRGGGGAGGSSATRGGGGAPSGTAGGGTGTRGRTQNIRLRTVVSLEME